MTYDYKDLPGFTSTTVNGHKGELVFGVMNGIKCVCMRGRFHYYEGNTMEQVVFPVRVSRLLGVKLLLVTNAAGGLNPEFNVGDIMIIRDHFSLPTLAGNNPCIGHNNDALGPVYITGVYYYWIFLISFYHFSASLPLVTHTMGLYKRSL